MATRINYGSTSVRDFELGNRLPPLEVALAWAELLGLSGEELRCLWLSAYESLNEDVGWQESGVSSPVPGPIGGQGSCDAGADNGRIAMSSRRGSSQLGATEVPRRDKGQGWRPNFAAVLAGLMVVVGVAIVIARPSSNDGPSPAVAPPQDPTGLPLGVLRVDDFAVAGAWPHRDDDAVTYGQVDGQYRLAVKQPNRLFAADAPATVRGGNIRLEVDATKVTAAPGTSGFMCRVGLGPNPPKYFAGIGTAGYWEILKLDGGGRPPQHLARAVEPAQFSPAVKASGPNRIGLECLGGEAPGEPVVLRLSVNGRLVAEKEDHEGLGPGNVALAVYSADQPIEVRFDNFVATRY